jgi:hypothetical protein
MKALLPLAFAVIALGGCGQDPAETMLNVVATAADLITAGETGAAAAAEPGPAATGFTPEEVAATPEAYRLVTINALGIAELARRITPTGERETFVAQSGFTATYEDGILIATRGLVGEDIMAANAPGLLDALAAGEGTITRTIEILDSLNRIQASSFTCTLTAQGVETINLGIRSVEAQRVDENCRGAALIFDNIYWLDADESILASRQYVSPTVAYLRSNRL